MRIHQFISDHIVALNSGVAGSAAVTGVMIATINPWLQAGAFIVSMIAGVCAIAEFVHRRQLRKQHREQQPKV